MDWASMVTVGRIVRPHGHRGQVVVAAETDYPEDRFAVGAVVYVLRAGEPGTMTIVASRPYDGRWVVGFDGIASMNEAETCRGWELRIPAASVKPLEPGHFYVHDLAGCAVETVAGAAVGLVRDVDFGTGVPSLVVDSDEGEVMVPLVDAICRLVDVAARRIVIDPPEGLIDLNRKTSRGDGR